MDAFIDYIGNLSDEEKAQAYVKIKSIPPQDQLDTMVNQAMDGVTRVDMEEVMLQAVTAQTGMSSEEMADYITAMTDEDITEMYTQMVTEQVKMQYAAQVQAQLSAMQPAQLSAALDAEMESYTAQQCAVFYDEVLEFSDSSYESNLLTLFRRSWMIRKRISLRDCLSERTPAV